MRAIKHRFKKATSTPKGRVVVSIILLVILLAITGGIVYWQTHKKKIIREKLEAAIKKKGGGLYTVKYESLDLDEITGYLSVTNLTLSYDSLKYEAMKDINLIPPILLKIHIPEISVKGVKTPRALLSNEIIGRILEIKNPSIEIQYTMRGKDSTRNIPTKEIYEQILGGLNEISLDTVAVTGVQIITHNLKTRRTGVKVTNGTIQLMGVKIDSAANADTSRILFAREIMAGCEAVEWKSDIRPYTYRGENISLYSENRIAAIGEFHIIPQLGEDAFVRSLPVQDDRFDFSFNDISIDSLDFRQLMQEEVIANHIQIRNANFKIYRDLNIPRDKKNRVGTYPHQILAKLPVSVYVKKLTIGNAFLEYKERNFITKKAGKVQFYDVNATITNLTNIKEFVARNNHMNADINSRFLNKTPFRSSWIFYLGNPNGRFDIDGKVGSINAKDLNPLTEPMGPARMQDGVLKSYVFNLKGSNYSMDGRMTLLYDHLKIALLEKDKGATKWDKKSLASLAANFFIKNSNPSDDDKEPRTVEVTEQRNTNRSIFYLAWKTMFRGIKQSMGIKK